MTFHDPPWPAPYAPMPLLFQPIRAQYTFGLEFTSDGLPVTTIGDWSLDKRHYMSSYPPKQLEPPPACAGKAAATLYSLFNQASGKLPTLPPVVTRGMPSPPYLPWCHVACPPHPYFPWCHVSGNISNWPTGLPSLQQGGVRGTKGWGDGGLGGGVLGRTSKGGGALTEAAYRRSPLAQAAATRGPWKWAGQGPVLFFRGGRMYTPWGSGRWSIAGDALAGARSFLSPSLALLSPSLAFYRLLSPSIVISLFLLTPAFSRLLSPPLTSSHHLSPPLTSSHSLSPSLTLSHLLSLTVTHC